MGDDRRGLQLRQSLHIVANPLPSSASEQQKKLRQLADGLARSAPLWPVVLSDAGLTPANTRIQQVAVGDTSLALLFGDGRVARVSLNVFPDRINLTGKSERKSRGGANKSGGGAVTTTAHNCASSGGGGGDPNVAQQTTGGAGGTPSIASRTAKIRRVMMAARNGRTGRGPVIVGSRPLIPASSIPEELVAQAQVVLQGKSRDVIVRELQRTNLNVNEAVNNLLSREDEDGDDIDDRGDASYIPEELLTLLDDSSVILDAGVAAGAGQYHDIFDMQMAQNVARRRMEREQLKEASKSTRGNGGQPSSNSAAPATGVGASATASDAVQLGSTLSFWKTADGDDRRFSHIGALHSHLLGVAESDGKLYRWAWNDATAEQTPHRICDSMKEEEKVTAIDCSIARCTVLTSIQRVGALTDDALGVAIQSHLDTSLFDLDLPADVRVLSVHACPLYSAARCPNGQLYWWGLLPFNDRKKKWDKVKQRVKQPKHVTFADAATVLRVGAEVRLRSNPIYQAGSIGFTTVNGYPQVGELMEAAWTLTETCRFRIKTAEQLKLSNVTTAVGNAGGVTTIAVGSKRPLSEDTTGGAKEEAWNLKDVSFVGLPNESRQNHDVGRIVVMDGAHCGVLFPKTDGSVIEISEESLKAVRLLRKDDIVAVGINTVPRCPESLQRTPKKLILPHGKNVIDITLESLGVRMLGECDGELRLLRCSLQGKVGTDRRLPVSASAFRASPAEDDFAGRSTLPFCYNYGDDTYQMIRDGNGCLLPISRDADTENPQIRRPDYFQLGPINALALGIQPMRFFSSNPRCNRLGITALVVEHCSLMRSVQHCDVDAVKAILADCERDANLDRGQLEIANGRVDGNRNALHCAVVNCMAANNRDNVDGGDTTTASLRVEPPSYSAIESGNRDEEAVATRNLYEARWEQLVARSRRNNPPFSVNDLMQMGAGGVARSNSSSASVPVVSSSANEGGAGATSPAYSPAAYTAQSPAVVATPTNPLISEIADDSQPKPVLPEENLNQVARSKPVTDSKQRQRNALEILRTLCDHPFMTGYLLELLSTRDGNGLTPFMLAVQCRCYTAALHLWDTAQRLARATGSQYRESLMATVYPPGAKPNDNPLFVLCYNDTCSFTWTGDEHINQDIFECRTCGLTGTLCCCTECAFVCHKDHDCKLKRTSPTAYCDCWERCACKALIAGNQTARFDLLNKLLSDTDLVTHVNSRNEHILLFLARTVGRQLIEQKQQKNHRSKHSKSAPDSGMPEHDLEPPKFAKKALEKLLFHYQSVKSMLLTGWRRDDENEVMEEERFFLNSQKGVTFLDRFVYSLLGRCGQEMLDSLLITLIREKVKLDAGGSAGDADIDVVCGRFVRSCVRIFVVVSVCTTQSTSQKRKSSHLVTMKCRRVFQSLIDHGMLQLAAAADALMAPTRMGILKPTQQFSLITNSIDVVEPLEKLFSADPIPIVPSDGERPAPAPPSSKSRRRNVSGGGGSQRAEPMDVGFAAPTVQRRRSDTATRVSNTASESRHRDQSREGQTTKDDGSADDSDSDNSDQDIGANSRRPSMNMDQAPIATAENSLTGMGGDEDSNMAPEENSRDGGDDSASPFPDESGVEAALASAILDVVPRGETWMNAVGSDSSNAVASVDQGRHRHSETTATTAILLRTPDVHHNSTAVEGEESREFYYSDGDGESVQSDGEESRHEDETQVRTFILEEDEEGMGDEEPTLNIDSNDDDDDEEDEDDDDDEQEEETENRHDQADDDDSERSSETANMSDDEDAAGDQASMPFIPISSSVSAAASAAMAAASATNTSLASSVPQAPPPTMGISSAANDAAQMMLQSFSTDAQQAVAAGGSSRSTEWSDLAARIRNDAAAAAAAAGANSSADFYIRQSRSSVHGTTTTAPTISWAVRQNVDGSSRHRRTAADLATVVTAAGDAMTMSLPVTTATSGTVPPPERGSFYIVDTSSMSGSGRGLPPEPAYSASNDTITLIHQPPASVQPPTVVTAATALPTTRAPTTANTASLLARVYNLLVRQLTDLTPSLMNYRMMAPNLPCVLVISKEKANDIMTVTQNRLNSTWYWLYSVLDTLEAQLKFGTALAASTDLRHGIHQTSPPYGYAVEAMKEFLRNLGSSGVHKHHHHTTAPLSAALSHHHSAVSGVSLSGSNQAQDPYNSATVARRKMGMGLSGADGECGKVSSESARSGFVGYVLSLMRAQSAEHADEYPVIDIACYKHVAFIADALFNWLDAIERSKEGENAQQETDESIYNITDLLEECTSKDGESESVGDKVEQNMNRFFTRSPSLLYAGIENNVGAFDRKLFEAVPIAHRPQLLRADTPREHMLGLVGQSRPAKRHLAHASESGNRYPTHQSLAEAYSAGETSNRGLLEAGASTPPQQSRPLPECDTPVTSQVRKVLESAVSETSQYLSPTKPSTRHYTTRQSARLAAAKTPPPSSEKRSHTVIVHSKDTPSSCGENGRAATADVETLNQQVFGGVQLTKSQLFLGRWKLTLTVLARLYSEHVGNGDPQSVLVQMAGFLVTEARFRKEMEKLRNGQTRDLTLEVDRERHLLIQQTIKQLNQQYNRRSYGVFGGGSGSSSHAPMTVHRVKVVFKGEPGEGSGVARSFYAAIAEAFLSPDRLPSLDNCQGGGGSGGNGGSTAALGKQHQLQNRLRQRAAPSRGGGEWRRRPSTTRRFPLSAEAPPFFLPGSTSMDLPTASSDANADPFSMAAAAVSAAPNWDPSKQTMGERLFPKVRQLRPTLAHKITGMLLELEPHQLLALLTHDETLRAHVEDAVDLVLATQNQNSNQSWPSSGPPVNEDSSNSGDSTSNQQQQQKAKKSIAICASSPNLLTGVTLDPEEMIDSAALFFQPSDSSFYSPVPGKQSAERLNAFRNVGRLMGICLLQNEVLPLSLCRHVFKWVVGRPINWYDVAFFDATLFESLRSLADASNTDDAAATVAEMELTFSCQLSSEEGSGSVELKPGGFEIPVTTDNVTEYIYRYVEYRLVTLAKKPLEAIKQGVYDVLPPDALKGLTAEDIRLILCGHAHVSTRVLQSYTSFADESSAPSEQLNRFKKWFWSIVGKMEPAEKQDLVYFWTGSPALPSSEDGYQPLPSVMIRPADDHHLPTANTCISRLYLPLYSTKQILKQKLLVAIKARNFGFV